MKHLSIIITALAGFHYFISYRILHGYLEIHNFEDKGIITINDVTYQFGDIVFDMLVISSLGFLWIGSWELFVGKKIEERMKADFLESMHLVGKSVKEWTSNLRKHWGKLTTLILIVAAITVGLYLWTKASLTNVTNPILIPFCIVFFIVPFAYIAFRHKRVQILAAFIFCIVLFNLKFVNVVLSSIQEEGKSWEIKEPFEFTYGDEHISSGDSIVSVYHGYAYLLTKNLHTNEYRKFRQEKVDDFKFVAKE